MMERFTEKFMTEPNSGCWIWTASCFGDGYGQFKYKNKNWRAHRLAYTWAKGGIPDGLVIDHLCRNTFCVNPSHLEAVTVKENTNRGVCAQREKTHCPAGHPYVEGNLLKVKYGRACRACSIIRQKKKYWENPELARAKARVYQQAYNERRLSKGKNVNG